MSLATLCVWQRMDKRSSSSSSLVSTWPVGRVVAVLHQFKEASGAASTSRNSMRSQVPEAAICATHSLMIRAHEQGVEQSGESSEQNIFKSTLGCALHSTLVSLPIHL